MMFHVTFLLLFSRYFIIFIVDLPPFWWLKPIKNLCFPAVFPLTAASAWRASRHGAAGARFMTDLLVDHGRFANERFDGGGEGTHLSWGHHG